MNDIDFKTPVKHTERELVEVVRCKDCNNKKCWERTGNVVCGIDGKSHSPDCYCADGVFKKGR